jgi:hypothetical protein
MKPSLACLAPVAACALLAGPACAQSLPTGGMTAEQSADWIRGQGLKADVMADPTTPGDQIVRTSVDGINFDIYFYGCTSDPPPYHRCDSMQYAAGWSNVGGVSSDRLNEWNRENRFLRAYISSKGSVFGEMDIDISPGLDYSALNRSLDRWRSAIGKFRSSMGLP